MELKTSSKKITFVLLLAGLSLVSHAEGQAEKRVSIVVDSELARAATHGLETLHAALEQRGFRVRERESLAQAEDPQILALGSSTSRAVRELANQAGLTLPSEPEALLIHNLQWQGRDVLLLSGSDDRGLMYAVLEVAEQVRLAADNADPLAQISNTQEEPALRVRSVSRMLMNRAVVEKYFYSEEYWDQYFSMLAKDRYNTFTLMFGYGSAGYFDPPYPFLFDVEGFPQVRVIGITSQQQQRNREMLRRIMQMAHDRGLDFVVALWTHIFEPGYNNFIGGEPKPGLPAGLTRENLIPYTKVALHKFLEMYPEIDGIQFRVHTESSVTLPQQKHFWTEVLKVVSQVRPQVPVYMRAKGFTDDLIDAMLALPVDMRMTTKYWGEEMGLPYHPTQDSLANKYKRRHSYADLLRYPQRYEMLWRLWAHGTVKFLLWGDPGFARRFAQTTRLYDGLGFDLHEPLAMKMGYKLGLHEGPDYELLSEDYRHYKWEFERYWRFYQVFGRMGYNLDTQPQVFAAEFRNRFGEEAGPLVEQAYSAASWILPRIVAYATRDLSAGFTWPEKQRWEDLPEYIHVRPSDTAQFLGVAEAAHLHLAGKHSAKIWPEQNSRWFQQVSDRVLELAAQADRAAGDSPKKEFRATIVDMKVLAYLAAYHARRLKAGFQYALFEETGDLNALDDAIGHERKAIATWRKIVAVTDGVYPDNIIMGRAPRMSGSWKTELDALEKGLKRLEEKSRRFQPQLRETVAQLDFGDGPIEKGYLGVTSETDYVLGKTSYGWHHIESLPSPSLSKVQMKDERNRDFIHGPEPDRYTYSAFGIDLPNGYYEVQFSMVDRSQQPRNHGPMWIVAQGNDSTEHFRVPAGKLVEKTLTTEVVDGRLNVVFNSATDGDWIINSMRVIRIGPRIAHVAVRKTVPGRDVVIRTTASGPNPIEHVYLNYSAPNGSFRRLPMESTGLQRYQAVIPKDDLFDGMEYFLEAVDGSRRRVFYPRQGSNRPQRVTVTSDTKAPEVQHVQHDMERARGGRQLLLRAQVSDRSGVDSVFVRYRGVNQHQDFRKLRLLPAGKDGWYEALIPGEHIDDRWDFMYYVEVMDRHGNGTIHPDMNKETPYVVIDLDRQASAASNRPSDTSPAVLARDKRGNEQ